MGRHHWSKGAFRPLLCFLLLFQMTTPLVSSTWIALKVYACFSFNADKTGGKKSGQVPGDTVKLQWTSMMLTINPPKADTTLHFEGPRLPVGRAHCFFSFFKVREWKEEGIPGWPCWQAMRLW